MDGKCCECFEVVHGGRLSCVVVRSRQLYEQMVFWLICFSLLSGQDGIVYVKSPISLRSCEVKYGNCS